jgi:hypothetical protein
VRGSTSAGFPTGFRWEDGKTKDDKVIPASQVVACAIQVALESSSSTSSSSTTTTTSSPSSTTALPAAATACPTTTTTAPAPASTCPPPPSCAPSEAEVLLQKVLLAATGLIPAGGVAAILAWFLRKCDIRARKHKGLAVRYRLERDQAREEHSAVIEMEGEEEEGQDPEELQGVAVAIPAQDSSPPVAAQCCIS